MKQALILFAIIAVFLNSCSQYAAPIGGKKDTLAPGASGEYAHQQAKEL
jgi:PBP1b-binding outer membrane lipoprotein LpoB